MSVNEITQVIVPTLPQVKPGVRAWTFFPANARQDAAYVIGTEECDRYVFVPGRRLDVVQMALEQMDGAHSVDSITTRILEQRKVKMDVAELCRKLDAAGLLASSKQSPEQGDIDKLSIRLGNIDLSVLLRFFKKSICFVPGLVLAALCGLLMVCGLSILIAKMLGLAFLRSSIRGNLTQIHFTWELVGMLLATMLLHELAHLVAASYAGLRQARGHVYLYMIFIPLVGLRLRGFYTLSAGWRCVVWAAGSCANFSMASLALILLQWGPSGWSPLLHNVLGLNWVVGMMSLFPFLPTDGYYIVATLLRQMNIRVRALAALGTLLNLRRTRPTLLVGVYALANVLLLGTFVFNNVRRLVNGAVAHRPEVYVKAIILLGGLAFVIWTIWKGGRTVETHSVHSAAASNTVQPGRYP